MKNDAVDVIEKVRARVAPQVSSSLVRACYEIESEYLYQDDIEPVLRRLRTLVTDSVEPSPPQDDQQ